MLRSAARGEGGEREPSRRAGKSRFALVHSAAATHPTAAERGGAEVGNFSHEEPRSHLENLWVALTAILLLLTVEGYAGSAIIAERGAISTASPYATAVGVNILREGGNAIDAAVASALVLAVAHPHAGNIGGGGFLVYYDAESRGVWTLDFRELSPALATRAMFTVTAPDGTVSSGKDTATTGALAAAVPGTLAGLEEAHRKFGRLPWRALVTPAAQLARDGVSVSNDLSAALETAKSERGIDRFPATAARFYPAGKPLAAGALLVQTDLAETLEKIGRNGARELHEFSTAKNLVRTLQREKGIITFRDLREYLPIWRAPIRIDFGEYEIYAMAPPSTAGLMFGQTLGILAGFDLAKHSSGSAESIHFLAEAERRAAFDGTTAVGDPGLVRIPYRELLSEERASLWRGSINPARATPTVLLQRPSPRKIVQTTHLTVTDSSGNLAALTTTLDDLFGSGLLVDGGGFFLNSGMGAFTLEPDTLPGGGGLPDPNTVEPRKRMRSSMSPLIVLKAGKPFLGAGTLGGASIPGTLLQIFLHLAVHGKTLAEAVAAPRYHHEGIPEEIFAEKGLAPAEVLQRLFEMGHGVKQVDPVGDVHAIWFANDGIHAVADPRHGGAAGGY